MPENRRPTNAQLRSAIEGANDMPEAARGAGKVLSPGDSPADPAAETGGPRGSGYPPSRTSGGAIDDKSGAYGVEPDEFIKRETAVFEAGTHGRKPVEALPQKMRGANRGEPGDYTPEQSETAPAPDDGESGTGDEAVNREAPARTPGSAEGERDPSQQSR
jgi:hypothetical protein